MPVVWKGTLTQYTGRLHRAAPGKREVLLYDYVDVRVPMLEQQYRRRLRSYAALAYTVRGSTAVSDLDDHAVQKRTAAFVSCEQFSQRFAEDLEAAAREALFCVSSLSARPVQRMIPLLQRLQHKGGEVRIYLPEPAQFRGGTSSPESPPMPPLCSGLASRPCFAQIICPIFVSLTKDSSGTAASTRWAGRLPTRAVCGWMRRTWRRSWWSFCAA